MKRRILTVEIDLDTNVISLSETRQLLREGLQGVIISVADSKLRRRIEIQTVGAIDEKL